MFTSLLQQHDNHPPDVSRPRARQDLRPFAVQAPKPEAKDIVIVTRIVITIVIIIVIARMPHICGMDTYGMKIMPQMSGIATFQDIYGMLIFEDEHAIDV